MQVPLDQVADPIARLLILYTEKTKSGSYTDVFKGLLSSFNEQSAEKMYALTGSGFLGFHCGASDLERCNQRSTEHGYRVVAKTFRSGHYCEAIDPSVDFLSAARADFRLSPKGRLALLLCALSFVESSSSMYRIDFERASYRILVAGIVGEVLGIEHLREDPNAGGFKKLDDKKHLKNPEDFWKMLEKLKESLAAMSGDEQRLEFIHAVRSHLDQRHYQEHLTAVLSQEDHCQNWLLSPQFTGFVQSADRGKYFYEVLSSIWQRLADGAGKQKKFKEIASGIIQRLEGSQGFRSPDIFRRFFEVLSESSTTLKEPDDFLRAFNDVLSSEQYFPPLGTTLGVKEELNSPGKTPMSLLSLILQNTKEAEKEISAISGKAWLFLEDLASKYLPSDLASTGGFLTRGEELGLLNLVADVYRSLLLNKQSCVPCNALIRALVSMVLGVLQIELETLQKNFTVEEVLAILHRFDHGDSSGVFSGIWNGCCLLSGLLNAQDEKRLNVEFLKAAQGKISKINPGVHLLLPSFFPPNISPSLFFRPASEFCTSRNPTEIEHWLDATNYLPFMQELCLDYGRQQSGLLRNFQRKVSGNFAETQRFFSKEISGIKRAQPADRVVDAPFFLLIHLTSFAKHQGNNIQHYHWHPLMHSFDRIIYNFSGRSTGCRVLVELMKGLKEEKSQDFDSLTYRLLRLAMSMIFGIPEHLASTDKMLTTESGPGRSESKRIDNSYFVPALLELADSLCNEPQAAEFINLVFGKMTHEDAGIWLRTAVGLGPKARAACFTPGFSAYVKTVGMPGSKERRAVFEEIATTWEILQKNGGKFEIQGSHVPMIAKIFMGPMSDDWQKVPSQKPALLFSALRDAKNTDSKKLSANFSCDGADTDEGKDLKDGSYEL